MPRWEVLAATATLAACVPALSASTARPDESQYYNRPSWKMPHHSFNQTVSASDALDDWLPSASTMPLRNRVQLLPPVPNRYGVLWNRRPLTTREFEVSFVLSVFASKRVPKDGVFAFWISPQDFASHYNEMDILTTSKDWSEGLKATGLTFIHNRPNFSGLALVFSGLNRQRSEGQSVTAMWGDGNRKVAVEDVVEGEGAQTTFRDWLADSTVLRIRVYEDGSIVGSMMTLDARTYLAETVWAWLQDGDKPTALLSFLMNGTLKVNDGPPFGSWTVLGGRRMRIDAHPYPSSTWIFGDSITATQEEPATEGPPPKLRLVTLRNASDYKEKVSQHNVWVDIFTFPAGTMTNNLTESFIGFSGWTGSNSSIELSLHEVNVLNFDTAVMGERDSDVLGRDTAEWLKVLAQEYHFIDQASQTEAIVRLTKLLEDHVESFDQLGEKLRRELITMETRVERLAGNISAYLHMAQAWVLATQQFNPKVVKEHIANVRSILTKDRAAAELAAVNDVAAALKAEHTTRQLHEGGSTKIGSVTEQSRVMEELARSGSVQGNALLLVMVVATATLGLLFLNRMRYYEKKHYM